MGEDRLYIVPKPLVSDFNFGPETAAVFDDMLNRSVPFYAEIQRMIAEIAEDFAVDRTNVYDLGCSTCATFRNLEHIDKDVTFIGMDDSAAMLARAEAELKQAGFSRRHDLREQDLHKDIDIQNASVVILCLTLQFVRPLFRERLMQTVFKGLNHQGCFILVEKVLSPETLINRLFIKYYHDFKRRNGYSEIEIGQKREALENVLIPYRLEENEQLLRAAGFKHVEVFFKWYNFCGLLGLKT
jgi:tRNA (cmo5U34)-methyltransferase